MFSTSSLSPFACLQRKETKSLVHSVCDDFFVSYLKNLSLIVFVFVLNLFVYSMKELVCVLSHIFSSQLRQRIALKLLVLLNLNATRYWMLNISEKNMNAKINIKIQTWNPRSIEFEYDWILDKAELFRTNMFQANSLYSKRQRLSYKWICLCLKPMHSIRKGNVFISL